MYDLIYGKPVRTLDLIKSVFPSAGRMIENGVCPCCEKRQVGANKMSLRRHCICPTCQQYGE